MGRKWLMEEAEMEIKQFRVQFSALLSICTCHIKMLQEMCERTDRFKKKKIGELTNKKTKTQQQQKNFLEETCPGKAGPLWCTMTVHLRVPSGEASKPGLLFLFIVCTRSMWEFQSQGSNLYHNSDLNHRSDTRSLTQ